jgi:hypothetical protein
VGVAQNAAAQKDAAPKKDGGKKGPGNKGGGGDGGGSAPVAPKKPVSPPPSLTAQKTPVPPPKTIEAKGTPPKPVTEPPAGGITSGQASKFTAKPPEEPVGGRKGAGVQSKAGHAVGVAQVGLDIAEGKYGQALQGAATQVALNPNTYKAAASLAEEAGTVAKALGFIGKKIPLVGAVVTAGFVLYEVGSNVKDGNYTKALTAAGAGTAEALGNLVGFGVGDVAREGVRETIVRTAGEEYAPNKSGLRTLVEQGIEVGSKFVGDKPAGQQQAINTAKPPGPKGKPPALG